MKKIDNIIAIICWIVSGVLLLYVLSGCGPNRYIPAKFKYEIKVENSPGATIVLPFWADQPSTSEKYDTAQSPQLSAEVPLVGRSVFPNARSFADIPPNTRSLIYIWSGKRGYLTSEQGQPIIEEKKPDE